MTDEEFLALFDELLRSMPSKDSLRTDSPDVLNWLGRAAAVFKSWQPISAVGGQNCMDQLRSPVAYLSHEAANRLVVHLHTARADLLLKTRGPVNVVIPDAMVFDYFDQLRRIIETAKTDILFVDPYLNAEFVSRYLPHVTSGVTVRLLGHHKASSLLSAAEAFAKQYGHRIEIRSAANLHDRWLFIDGRDCYQSGASFKDGAKKATTTITQITDAFTAMHQAYQSIWNNANVLR